MAKSKKLDRMKVIEAAGGVLTQRRSGETVVALIHRPQYDDWTLPKGWREKGESWSEAAVREVREETNCKVTMKKFVGCTSYEVGKNPKIVLYWHMELVKEGEFDPSGETDQLIWVSMEKASSQLSYDNESRLVESSIKKISSRK